MCRVGGADCGERRKTPAGLTNVPLVLVINIYGCPKTLDGVKRDHGWKWGPKQALFYRGVVMLSINVLDWQFRAD